MLQEINTTVSEVSGMIRESVLCGESWLFTQNKPGHDDGRLNFIVQGSDALNGDWEGRPQKVVNWIAHLMPHKDNYCLWVGRFVPGDQGLLELGNGRYKLLMREVVCYSISDA
jgi:hypothetical protein